MARRGQSPKAQSKNPRDWKDFEFIRLELTDADKVHFKDEAAKNPQELWDAIVSLVEMGYKLTFSGDKANACFIASLTCKDELDDNYGYVLTSRSDDLYEAALLNAFKHLYLCKDGTWPKEAVRNNWG